MNLTQLKQLRNYFVENYNIAHQWADKMYVGNKGCLVVAMADITGLRGTRLLETMFDIWPNGNIITELREHKDDVLRILERKIAMYEEYELNQKEGKWDSQPEERNTEKSNVTVVNPEAHYNLLELIETN